MQPRLQNNQPNQRHYLNWKSNIFDTPNKTIALRPLGARQRQAYSAKRQRAFSFGKKPRFH
uniref:Uncharacterized protein n=1 Tax=Cucumis melo TaxID=3656 RepID=A0A9I9EF27_CUCME